MSITTTCEISSVALDDIAAALRLESGSLVDVLAEFDGALAAARSTKSLDQWRSFVDGCVRPHSVRQLIHEAPFTKRAFEKPRGYPGDAVTLDYIYGASGLPPHTTSRGERIFEWERQTDACRAIRTRRDALARVLHQLTNASSDARILSVACGHLREAQKCPAIRDGRFEEFIAFDQDPQSLAIVANEQGSYGVKPVQGSIRHVLSGKQRWAGLDLIYSAGLFDYLSDAVASALAERLFEMLRPGGRLLIANLTPDLRNIAYMEAMMDWWLIYRDEMTLRRVTRPLAARATSLHVCRHDPCVAFIELTR
ncbi:MAG TPA: class I SAM-dependent methyltransferase [Vicinamibacterales bacterium]|jgi:SAM-dependent methyltransferase|nr:class I SAM-dependent methyltransferase [Vicinamibacterales bacterium]